MKASLPNLSSLCLPKITSQHLEQMIKSKKKPEILATDLCRNSYKNYDKLPAQRSLRLTEDRNRFSNHPNNHEFISQHLKVKSPFYQRMSAKHFGKQKCNCHQNKENSAFPRLRHTHCSHYDQIIAHKKYLMKQFHDNIVSTIKQNHAKNHEVIEKNKFEYLHYSHENSVKIKEQKVKLTEKNKQENQNKIAKTKTQAQMQKELITILLKERLDQMYNLDNQNQPFEKVLLKRNRWQTKRNVWKGKILTNIRKKLNQAKEMQSKLQKTNQSKIKAQESAKSSQAQLIDSQITQMSQTKIIFAYKENQKILQDIESCLGVLMKNVSSISDMVPKYQSKQIKERINQIFKKNLNIEAPHYAKKLRKMMGDIIEDIVSEETEAKMGKKNNNVESFDKIDKKDFCQQITQNKGQETYRKSYKSYKSHSNKNSKLISANSLKSLNCSVTNLDEKSQAKLKELANQKSALQMKAEQSLLSASLLSTSYLAPINEQQTINLDERKFPENKKFSILSGKSTNSKRKHSGLSKLSFMSNSLKRSSMLSSNWKNTSGNDQSIEKSQKSNSPSKKEQTQELGLLSLTKNSTSVSYNHHNPTPLLSKQVIFEKEELEMGSDDQQLQRTARALKYYRSAKQHEQQIEKNRIDGMINLMKQKIMSKKEGVQQTAIPQSYLKINYDEFCTQKTFNYIASTVQKFEGVKRFKFIYSQLRAKKRILNDHYVQNLIKEFEPMIGDDKELEEWKQFILDCRTKIMFDSLNRMIDMQMQVMENLKETEGKEGRAAQNEQVAEEEVPKECMIFQKIDESQMSFERYLQRLLRKNQKQSEPQRMSTIIKAVAKVQAQDKQQSPQVSQKTIHSQIQTNSTKQIRYKVIDHSPTNKNVHKTLFGSENPLLTDGMGLQYKKKVLGYLLRKNPQKFQQLNRNLSEVSRLLCGGVEQGNQEGVVV